MDFDDAVKTFDLCDDNTKESMKAMAVVLSLFSIERGGTPTDLITFVKKNYKVGK